MHWPITPKEGDIDKGEDIFAFFNSFISCLIHPRAVFPSAVRSPLKRISCPLCSDKAKPPTGQNPEDGEVVCVCVTRTDLALVRPLLVPVASSPPFTSYFFKRPLWYSHSRWVGCCTAFFWAHYLRGKTVRVKRAMNCCRLPPGGASGVTIDRNAMKGTSCMRHHSFFFFVFGFLFIALNVKIPFSLWVLNGTRCSVLPEAFR